MQSDLICPCCGKPKKKVAESWKGHRYGLQALKPAVEPVIVFQKPYEGKPLDNIVSTGAGALNIDAARIPTQDEYVINQFDDGMKPFGNGAGHSYKSIRVPQSNPKNRQGIVGTDLGISNADIEKFQQAQRESTERMASLGRWPSNLILDEGSAERLDLQSGNSKSSSSPRNNKEFKSVAKGFEYAHTTYGHDDSGGASRFFYQVSTQLDEADPFLYQSKVSPKERNAGLDELEDIKMAVSGGAQGADGRGEDEYLQDSIGLNRIKIVKNNHPTLKPINLAKYLAILLLPPVEYAPRRIFIPFSGTMSEAIGAGLAGWEHIVAVESDTENDYVDIGEKRMQYWMSKK